MCPGRGVARGGGAGLPEISDDKGLHWFFGNKYKYSTGLFVVLLSTVVRHWEGMIPIRLRPPVYAIVCPSSFYVSHQSWLFFLKNFYIKTFLRAFRFDQRKSDHSFCDIRQQYQYTIGRGRPTFVRKERL